MPRIVYTLFLSALLEIPKTYVSRNSVFWLKYSITVYVVDNHLFGIKHTYTFGEDFQRFFYFFFNEHFQNENSIFVENGNDADTLYVISFICFWNYVKQSQVTNHAKCNVWDVLSKKYAILKHCGASKKHYCSYNSESPYTEKCFGSTFWQGTEGKSEPSIRASEWISKRFISENYLY